MLHTGLSKFRPRFYVLRDVHVYRTFLALVRALCKFVRIILETFAARNFISVVKHRCPAQICRLINRDAIFVRSEILIKSSIEFLDKYLRFCKNLCMLFCKRQKTCVYTYIYICTYYTHTHTYVCTHR